MGVEFAGQALSSLRGILHFFFFGNCFFFLRVIVRSVMWVYSTTYLGC